MENDPAEILKKKRIFVSTKSAGAPWIYTLSFVHPRTNPSAVYPQVRTAEYQMLPSRQRY